MTELYMKFILPAFKAAVQEGDTWSIMGAYDMYKISIQVKINIY